MRTVKHTSQFKKDYRREKRSQHKATLDTALSVVINQLVADKPLPVKNRDHALTGQWCDHRDCHIKPDLVLIYRKPDNNTVELVRLGSHSCLGL